MLYPLCYISASLERLILFIYPTIVILFSRIFLKEHISRNQFIAIIISYIGLLLIFGDGLLSPTDGSSTDVLRGGLFIICAAITYAAYLVGSQWQISKYSANRFTPIAMLSACAVMMIHYVTVCGFKMPELSQEVYLYTFLMAIFSTVLPSFLIANAIEKVNASTVSIVGSLGPVSTIVLSYIFLQEKISIVQGVGGLIIIAGVYFVKKKH